MWGAFFYIWDSTYKLAEVVLILYFNFSVSFNLNLSLP